MSGQVTKSKKLLGHSPGRLIRRLLFVSPDLLLSGSWDCSAKVWDVKRGSVMATLGHEHSVNDVEYAADQNCFMTACGRIVHQWDAMTFQKTGNIEFSREVLALAAPRRLPCDLIVPLRALYDGDRQKSAGGHKTPTAPSGRDGGAGGRKLMFARNGK
eukprot:TRINITY_DN2392_c1_g1_i2.p1 TRINITY_DN2392_c1_g1~~TRINITY_DN2392_c1_g1_i2.p1  ORF type:complete len:158 (+),score=11.77 TRINITY_DN2392_c1_g1_i2:134-607(+)